MYQRNYYNNFGSIKLNSSKKQKTTDAKFDNVLKKNKINDVKFTKLTFFF